MINVINSQIFCITEISLNKNKHIKSMHYTCETKQNINYEIRFKMKFKKDKQKNKIFWLRHMSLSQKIAATYINRPTIHSTFLS